MPEKPPVICNQCGHILGPKENEVLDPGNNEPENPHFKVQERDDGEERLQCLESGRLAAPIGHEDDDYAEVFQKAHGELPEGIEAAPVNDEPEETNDRVGKEREQAQSQDDNVFDFREEKDQMQLLAEVVSNPHYGLADEQISEIREWALDYNGQMPPDALESLVGNMSGVQKQTAKLIRKRYELKLNNWYREQQTEDSTGPPIGVMGGMGSPQRGPPQSRSRPNPPSRPDREDQESDVEEQEEQLRVDESEDGRRVGGLPNKDLRKERRQRRVKRRNDALDITAEEMAKEAAPEIAREITRNMGTYFGLPAKILEAKAEQDPDWFLEKADEFENKLGISILDILEDSQAKQEREQQGSARRNKRQTEIDDEMDEAVEQVRQEQPAARQNRQSERHEDTMIPDRSEETANSSTAEPPDEKETVNTEQSVHKEDGEEMTSNNASEAADESKDEMFSEIFGSGGGEK